MWEDSCDSGVVDSGRINANLSPPWRNSTKPVPSRNFPTGSAVKNPPANAGDASSIPGSRRPPGEGNGNPLQYPCLGNAMDRGAWQLTVHGVARIGHDLETKQQQQYMLQVYNMKAKITQSCLTLCNPMDYTVHRILQARILEWVAFPFSRGSSQPRDQTQVSRIVGNSLPDEPQGSLCTI